MSLQQQLSELQSLFNAPGGSKDQVQSRLGKLKLELVKSGLYFASGDASVDDLVATRSILEIGLLNALRSHNDEAYKSYRASLQPFYSLPNLPPSPHRPVVLGLHLLFHLANGNLTEFHTYLETLNNEELADDFVRLPVDLERWLMEGSYNKVYRAKDRMTRDEFAYLLEKLMRTVRNQIAATIEASYPSLKQQDAGPMLFFKPGETSALIDFAKKRNWQLHPSTHEFTFPPSRGTNGTNGDAPTEGSTVSVTASRDELDGGVVRGVPMRTLVGPALRLAQQLEAII